MSDLRANTWREVLEEKVTLGSILGSILPSPVDATWSPSDLGTQLASWALSPERL